jgi:hypothetical protein
MRRDHAEFLANVAERPLQPQDSFGELFDPRGFLAQFTITPGALRGKR